MVGIGAQRRDSERKARAAPLTDIIRERPHHAAIRCIHFDHLIRVQAHQIASGERQDSQQPRARIEQSMDVIKARIDAAKADPSTKTPAFAYRS